MPDPPPLPPHLARHVVSQDYEAYTPRDHAVWRHILTRLAGSLRDRAHPSYLPGLEATGIGLEAIPRLEEMDRKLRRYGWRAVGVRGFLPPAVFTEMQSLGVLAIAADIRSHRHVDYTPAPDIVHESAGHAPLLADSRYAAYLKRCGTAGFKAISSREDEVVFEAVRRLSVVREDPEATPREEREALEGLKAARAARTYVSEGTRASRLYWWTAEYGLMGPAEAPRLYGAGLLSSLAEAEHALGPEVARAPLTLACVDQDFDITTLQPRLYLARDFDHLLEVLEAFEATLAWRRGGTYGLREALRAGTVNHLVLDSGLELSGRVVDLHPGRVLLEGPTLLSRAGLALEPPRPGYALLALMDGAEPRPGPFRLALQGGDHLAGTLDREGNALRLRGAGDLPFRARLLTTRAVTSVAGGPADPRAWEACRSVGPEADPERVARIRKAQALPGALATLYREVRRLRDQGRPDPARLEAIRHALAAFPEDWLLSRELEELRPAAPTPTPEGTTSGPHLERP
jgi:phenylalanine-4-hydroxylase